MKPRLTLLPDSNLLRFRCVLPGFLVFLLCAVSLKAQVPLPVERSAAPQTNVTVDGSEAMFTTMCALHAAGFEEEVSSAGWHPLRARLREILRQQQGPAVEAIRNFYRLHALPDPAATLSRYIWFGLIAGPAPDFKLTLRHDELPPDVIAIEGYGELLAAYYREQNIGNLWRQVQPVYQKEIEQLHEGVTQVVFVSSGYLREMTVPSQGHRFRIVVEPMVGRITNVRNYGEHYAVVLSGATEFPVDVVRHAFLHYLLDSLPLRYPRVVAAKYALMATAGKAPRLPAEMKEDPGAWFTECLVRAVELKLKRMSPGEREAAMDLDDGSGYVLVRPIFGALAKFEKSEPAMSLFFPEMVRSIDVAAEAKRIEALQFLPAETAAAEQNAEQKEVTRSTRAALPSTLPNDPESIAALTEGERRIAEKNARAAEAAFQRVLAKYPEQPRAWYGLGLVAMMERDGRRAEQVFTRLVKGEHAASGDPLVLAWAHVYLGRLHEINSQAAAAKEEYEAALAVADGPQDAQGAARRGLAAIAAEQAGQPHP
jgi:hypothetical protein